mmetsp:Transcript_8988/g.14565  ORF Transcript_8988/g.14565 Transcript_8988/m.14565 type:complete len:280 (-) Transcript_8988:636-1475(-)
MFGLSTRTLMSSLRGRALSSSSTLRRGFSSMPRSLLNMVSSSSSNTVKKAATQALKKFPSPKKKMMIVGGIAGLLVGGAATTTALSNQVAAAEAGSSEKSDNVELTNMISVYDVPLGKKMPEVIPCFIEVSRGSRNKYEWDNEMGFLKLDRVLHSAVFYPHNYGFFPQTLCGDGDPLDVLVMGDLPLVPGSLVDVRPIAYMVMEDEKGMDEKVLAVVNKDPHYVEMKTLRDVPEHVLREIAHFFQTYKALEKRKWVKVGGWKGTASSSATGTLLVCLLL